MFDYQQGASGGHAATKRLYLIQSKNGLAVISFDLSEVPVVDMSPGDRVLDLLSCLPWTGARARLVPR